MEKSNVAGRHRPRLLSGSTEHMRHRTRWLKRLAVESVSLAVELFNRPSPIGRGAGSLLQLQHAFEMLMKAVIHERRGSIVPKGGSMSYKVNECLRILHSDLGLLDEDAVRTIAMLDAHRDAAQHAGVTMSEQALYLDVQAGVSLFRRLLKTAFNEELGQSEAFAGRVLPVTTNPPREFSLLADNDLGSIKGLLAGKRKQWTPALAKLHPYVLTNRAVENPFEIEQPSPSELLATAKELIDRPWREILPGLARLSLESEGTGASYSLRIVKTGAEAAPVRLVREDELGSEDAATVLQVDTLRRYPLLVSEIADHAGIKLYDTQALVYLLHTKDDPKLFKRVPRGRQTSSTYEDRYSHAALANIRQAVSDGLVDAARDAYSKRRK